MSLVEIKMWIIFLAGWCILKICINRSKWLLWCRCRFLCSLLWCWWLWIIVENICINLISCCLSLSRSSCSFSTFIFSKSNHCLFISLAMVDCLLFSSVKKSLKLPKAVSNLFFLCLVSLGFFFFFGGSSAKWNIFF